MIHITDCDRHLKKQNQDFNDTQRKHMRWVAIKTINKRSLSGIFFLLAGLIYLGAYVPILPGQESIYVCLFLATLSAIALRFAISVIILKKEDQAYLERFEISFFSIMTVLGALYGFIMVGMLHNYGFTWYVWLFFIYLACVSVGGFSSLCAWRRLSHTYIFLVTMPPVIGALTLQTELGTIVGISGCLYCIFVHIQVRIWNREYWNNRINFQLLTQRADELALEKVLSDQANQTKAKFLSSMSHELRTPLNAILGFSQLMKISRHSKLNDYQEKNMNQIIRSGELLLGLIDGVLDFSRMEAGRMKLNPEHFFPSEVMRECLEMLRNNAAEKNITLSGKKESDKGIYADRLRFKQVVINLITNAIKYNKDGGEVVFGCVDLPNGNVEIYVRDTGHGIPAEQLNKIFEPFERLDAANSQIEGTGIGLTISKKLIETMGGQVHVTSEEGIGSTFSIEMPAATPDIIPKAITSTSDT